MKLLKLKSVSYIYKGTTKPVLNNINMEFKTEKLYAITGKSGVGKTTLLSLISGLDTATEGSVIYRNEDIATLNRDRYRASNIGVVFQSYNLLTNATALDNVVLSMNISGNKDKTSEKKQMALEVLNRVGIDSEKAKRKVLKLSGGEQQRVAIARAIVHNPDIIIADEPTGNLDSSTERSIMKIFERLAHEDKKCVIIVTHSATAAEYADEVFELNHEKTHKC
ncbi:MAG: ABC transporter ATP-binding protein [Ruminococcus sp.]|nr:ABC transporter ATP-binding protein [Ruminococcus sp.]